MASGVEFPLLQHAALFRLCTGNTQRAEVAPIACVSASSGGGDLHAEDGAKLLDTHPALEPLFASYYGGLLRDCQRQRARRARGRHLLSALQPTAATKTAVREQQAEATLCVTTSGTTTRDGLLSPWVLLPAAPEGLYLQIPSCGYVSMCHQLSVSSEESQTPLESPTPLPRKRTTGPRDEGYALRYTDVIRYQSRQAHQRRCGGGSGGEDRAGGKPQGPLLNDEGYMYGYAFLLCGAAFNTAARSGGWDSAPPVSAGATSGEHKEEEGIVLCLLSTSPIFNTLHALVQQLVPVMCRCVRTFSPNATATAATARWELHALLARAALLPLRPLTNARSSHCAAQPFQSLSIPLGTAGSGAGADVITVQRPGDGLHPHLDTPLAMLLLSLSPDSLRLLHALLLQECRILFIGATAQHVSACVVAAPALVCPMVWASPIIPYLPPDCSQTSGLLDTLLAVPAMQEVDFQRMLSSSFSSNNYNSMNNSNSNNSSSNSSVFSGSAYLTAAAVSGGKGAAARRLESGGFLIGSTPDIVAAVLLRTSTVAAGCGGVAAADRVWVVDLRSGNVGVVPMDPLSYVTPVHVNSEGAAALLSSAGDCTAAAMSAVTVAVLPPNSEKLRGAVRRAVSEEQRHAFRVALEAVVVWAFGTHVAQADALALLEDLAVANRTQKGESGLPSSLLAVCNAAPRSYRMPSFPALDPAGVIDVHAAFLEYVTQRLLGFYRRGMITAADQQPKPQLQQSFQVRQPSTQPPASSATAANGGDVVLLSMASTLSAEMGSHTILANTISGTHMWRQFEKGLTCAETIGLSQVLRGGCIRGRVVTAAGGGGTGSEMCSCNYYLSHPRMVACLNLFFSRARRRFPELFLDLSGMDEPTQCAAAAAAARAGEATRTTSYMPIIFALAGVSSDSAGVSGAAGGHTGVGNVNNGGTKRGVRGFFSKAMKALNNSSGGGGGQHVQLVGVRAYVQAFSSFATRDTGRKANASGPGASERYKASLLTEFNFTEHCSSDGSGSKGTSEAVVVEAPGGGTDLLGGSAGGRGSSFSPGSRAGPAIACRLLPLDALHQFGSYHALLNPLVEENACTGFATGHDAVDEGAANIFTALGTLCPSNMRVWRRAEELRERALLTTPPERPDGGMQFEDCRNPVAEEGIFTVEGYSDRLAAGTMASGALLSPEVPVDYNLFDCEASPTCTPPQAATVAGSPAPLEQQYTFGSGAPTTQQRCEAASSVNVWGAQQLFDESLFTSGAPIGFLPTFNPEQQQHLPPLFNPPTGGPFTNTSSPSPLPAKQPVGWAQQGRVAPPVGAAYSPFPASSPPPGQTAAASSPTLDELFGVAAPPPRVLLDSLFSPSGVQ